MSGENRCANSEALARHEIEVDKDEKIYDQNCEDMFNELDEAVDMIFAIAKKYDLQVEALEYIEDKI